MSGTKYDGGKPDMALVDSSWIIGVAEVLTFGKKKYSAQNWRGGIEVMRLLSAALRHTFAFLNGEDVDPETGLSHLHHASCCLMFASWMVKNKPELDDRFKPAVAAAPPKPQEVTVAAVVSEQPYPIRIDRSYAP